MLGQVLLGFDNTCVQTYPSNNTGSRESKSRDQIGESDRVPVLKNYHSKNCIAKYLMTSEATLDKSRQVNTCLKFVECINTVAKNV